MKRFFLTSVGCERGVATLSAVLCFFMFFGGVAIQEYYSLLPCSLCIGQRILVIILFFFSLFAALCKAPTFRFVMLFFSFITAIFGFGVSLFHVYLQMYPSHSSACTIGSNFSFGDGMFSLWMEKLFSVQGSCSVIEWSWGIVTLPRLSVVLFLFLSLSFSGVLWRYCSSCCPSLCQLFRCSKK